jgi:GNAT superfamily N-acetyltransferase
MPATVRPLSPQDDLVALTDLIHAAYARRAASNLRYWATHQTVEDTARRFKAGHGLIAEANGQIVGTLTVRPPSPDSEVALYRDPTTWTLGQFAVLPSLQGRGIGRRLHDAALDFARSQGGSILALDTAAPATDLIATYRRWGYRVVGECDWRPHTNYISVVMSRTIDTPAHSKAAVSEAVVREFWRLMETNDFDSVKAVLAPGFVMEWPQSGERIRGADNYARMNAEYPATGRWRFRIDRLIASDAEVVTEVAITDGSQTAVAVSFFTVQNESITRLVEYWPEPYAPPANRSHLTEPLTS